MKVSFTVGVYRAENRSFLLEFRNTSSGQTAEVVLSSLVSNQQYLLPSDNVLTRIILKHVQLSHKQILIQPRVKLCGSQRQDDSNTKQEKSDILKKLRGESDAEI